MADDRPAALAGYFATKLFEGLPPSALGDIVEDMCREYESGEHLLSYEKGENALFVLSSGRVDIVAHFNGRTHPIGSRTVGEVVGEQSIIDRTTASADVIAVDRVSALRVPGHIVDRLISEEPKFARNLLEILSGKLREATTYRVRHRLEQRLLFAHFSSHVSREFVNELLRRGDDAGSARTVEAIVMFTDLRDFTKLSEEINNPEAVAKSLGPYFETVVDVIHENKGIVDKFIGDAVMAVWGHPALEKKTPDDVFRTVLEIRRRVASLRFGGSPVRMGFGIECGPVFMGNVGSEDKRSFTVLGSVVNFASRYESANKGDDGRLYAATFGPTFYSGLSEKHKAILLARERVIIKGAPDNQQTVYSLKEDNDELEAR